MANRPAVTTLTSRIALLQSPSGCSVPRQAAKMPSNNSDRIHEAHPAGWSPGNGEMVVRGAGGALRA